MAAYAKIKPYISLFTYALYYPNNDNKIVQYSNKNTKSYTNINLQTGRYRHNIRSTFAAYIYIYFFHWTYVGHFIFVNWEYTRGAYFFFNRLDHNKPPLPSMWAGGRIRPPFRKRRLKGCPDDVNASTAWEYAGLLRILYRGVGYVSAPPFERGDYRAPFFCSYVVSVRSSAAPKCPSPFTRMPAQNAATILKPLVPNPHSTLLHMVQHVAYRAASFPSFLQILPYSSSPPPGRARELRVNPNNNTLCHSLINNCMIILSWNQNVIIVYYFNSKEVAYRNIIELIFFFNLIDATRVGLNRK